MEINTDPIYVAYREMKLRHLPEQTIATHLFNIKKFIFRIDKPLEEITENDLEAYLERELSNKSGAYPKIISNSLSFFFNEILKLSSFEKELKQKRSLKFLRSDSEIFTASEISSEDSSESEPIKMNVILSQDDYVN